MVAQRPALVVEAVLGEHAPERRHARPGLAVGRFADAILEFLPAHRHSGVIRLDIENFGITGPGRAFLPQPRGGIRPDPQDFALDLPFPDHNAADLFEMERGLLVAGFVGAFQADEPAQRGGVAAFQSEDLVRGMAALFFSGVVVIVAPQDGTAENALDLQRLTALADFSGLGLVGSVDLVGGFLEELSDEFGGGLEDGGAQQLLKVGDEIAGGLGGTEGADQLVDLLVPGEVEDRGVRRFFLTPALRSWRDCAETSATCPSRSALKRS
jgi:hypothetical protein